MLRLKSLKNPLPLETGDCQIYGSNWDNHHIVGCFHSESISETKTVKYFFLSEGWSIGRVWASDGQWQITAWRRQPDIQRLNICIVENNELLWLYRAEEAVLTVEVKPMTPEIANQVIGQVVLKRLISAEQVIERLGTAAAKCQLQNIQQVVH